MSIKEGIKAASQGKLDDMREAFKAELDKKAAQKIEEKKVELAKNYFGK
jgi:hypothetical protein